MPELPGGFAVAEDVPGVRGGVLPQRRWKDNRDVLFQTVRDSGQDAPLASSERGQVTASQSSMPSPAPPSGFLALPERLAGWPSRRGSGALPARVTVISRRVPAWPQCRSRIVLPPVAGI